MDPEEFRAAGHALVDWIADRRASVEDGRVRPDVEPGQIADALGPAAPETAITFEELMRTVDEVIARGAFEMQHPMHFGWFPANASLASILGDMASSGLAQLGLSWESSPALSEVEDVTCDWMRQLVGLSDAWSGSIHDTASTACLVALLVARERATSFSQNRGGLASVERAPVVYTTSEGHSSVAKAALLAGYGHDNVRLVDIDPVDRSMRPDALAEAMAADASAGRTPAAVVATSGTTATTAFDPVRSIVDVAAEHGAFVHVDAAMAGSAMLLPEWRHLWDGVEGADSVSWNPHKWMGTILDTSLLYVRDVAELQAVMSTDPSYLQAASDEVVVQLRDQGIPLGRRFRALKLLFQLRLEGLEAIQHRISRDIDNARWLAQQVSETDGWELCAPVSLQTVCVRHRPTGPDGREVDGDELDAHTLAWARSINESGLAYLTPARLDSRWMVRVSIGVETTERRHVEALWNLMRTTAEAVA